MIIAFAGRRIDSPDTLPPRFPLENVTLVRKRMQAFFNSSHPSLLISSGACGADLIAMEVAGEFNIQRVMVLPFPAKEFRNTSVIDRPGDWGVLFDTIIVELQSTGKIVNLNFSQEDQQAYNKVNIEILDLASSYPSKASKKSIDEIVGLVAWEGKKREGADATAQFIEEARKRNIPIREIRTSN
jgi:hypothetical protein